MSAASCSPAVRSAASPSARRPARRSCPSPTWWTARPWSSAPRRTASSADTPHGAGWPSRSTRSTGTPGSAGAWSRPGRRSRGGSREVALIRAFRDPVPWAEGSRLLYMRLVWHTITGRRVRGPQRGERQHVASERRQEAFLVRSRGVEDQVVEAGVDVRADGLERPPRGWSRRSSAWRPPRSGACRRRRPSPGGRRGGACPRRGGTGAPRSGCSRAPRRGWRRTTA